MSCPNPAPVVDQLRQFPHVWSSHQPNLLLEKPGAQGDMLGREEGVEGDGDIIRSYVELVSDWF